MGQKIDLVNCDRQLNFFESFFFFGTEKVRAFLTLYVVYRCGQMVTFCLQF